MLALDIHSLLAQKNGVCRKRSFMVSCLHLLQQKADYSSQACASCCQVRCSREEGRGSQEQDRLQQAVYREREKGTDTLPDTHWPLQPISQIFPFLPSLSFSPHCPAPLMLQKGPLPFPNNSQFSCSAEEHQVGFGCISSSFSNHMCTLENYF